MKLFLDNKIPLLVAKTHQISSWSSKFPAVFKVFNWKDSLTFSCGRLTHTANLRLLALVTGSQMAEEWVSLMKDRFWKMESDDCRCNTTMIPFSPLERSVKSRSAVTVKLWMKMKTYFLFRFFKKKGNQKCLYILGPYLSWGKFYPCHTVDPNLAFFWSLNFLVIFW
jgi:hypothetical protein